MTTDPSPQSQTSIQLSEEQTAELFLSLRRKQGNWVQWGEACQQLQKAGHSPQSIFEQTGFEPIQQNQIIVAIQVYQTLVHAEVANSILAYFSVRGSDLLYEFRILNQKQRVEAAELIVSKQLDLDVTKEVVKALKDFSRLSTTPEHFSDHPGDGVAYQFWNLARQQADLQLRSRLIAKAFTFVQTPSARQQIEQLLIDFTVVPKQDPPKWPLYRIDTDDNLPRLLPLLGELPLSPDAIATVPPYDTIPPFNWVKSTEGLAWVALPGWQVILGASNPVAVLSHTDQLPSPPEGQSESVLVVIDRAVQTWDSRSYFLTLVDHQAQLQWFESEPDQALLGRVILVLRPPKILDSEYLLETWQLEE